jgi:putative FmdB family regulatory protein
VTTEAAVPTYQYACTACGHQLEAVQSFTDDPLTECPACEGRLRKLFSAVGIVFKGSGFYRTDSRNGSTADRDGTEKAGKSGADSSGGTEKVGAGATGAGATGASASGSGGEKAAAGSSSSATKSTAAKSTPAKSTAAKAA